MALMKSLPSFQQVIQDGESVHTMWIFGATFSRMIFHELIVSGTACAVPITVPAARTLKDRLRDERLREQRETVELGRLLRYRRRSGSYLSRSLG